MDKKQLDKFFSNSLVKKISKYLFNELLSKKTNEKYNKKAELFIIGLLSSQDKFVKYINSVDKKDMNKEFKSFTAGIDDKLRAEKSGGGVFDMFNSLLLILSKIPNSFFSSMKDVAKKDLISILIQASILGYITPQLLIPFLVEKLIEKTPKIIQKAVLETFSDTSDKVVVSLLPDVLTEKPEEKKQDDADDGEIFGFGMKYGYNLNKII